jgi:hypothetical protein
VFTPGPWRLVRLYTHVRGRLRNYLADVAVADHPGQLGLAVVVEVEFNALTGLKPGKTYLVSAWVAASERATARGELSVHATVFFSTISGMLSA